MALFVPSLAGLLFAGSAESSIAWSLCGSVLIAAFAQTRWYMASDGKWNERLLRPTFMFHFFFLSSHVVGGAFHALDAEGYRAFARAGLPRESELAAIAIAQQLMLLGHAGVTAGMRIVGPAPPQPRCVVRTFPPHAFAGFTIACMLVASALTPFPELANVGHKLLDLALAAILVHIVVVIRARRAADLVLPGGMFVVNFVEQLLSGWKAGVVWTVTPLAAMLYPLMRKRVLIGATVFLTIWIFYIYPFGLALRPLIWYQGVDRDTAAAISWDRAVSMSFDERLDNLWTMLTMRANDLGHFQIYLRYVPETHSFYGTRIVADAAVAVIPRFFWPGKPDMELSSMNRVYDAGAIRRGAWVSAKPNVYQDGYMSWGWRGVLIASILCGMIIMFVNRLCERWFGGYEIGTCLVYTGLFASTVNLPSSFEFFIGGVSSAMFMAAALHVAGRVAGVVRIAGTERTRRSLRGPAATFGPARGRLRASPRIQVVRPSVH